MAKETLPLTECGLCARLDSCPIPSDVPDMRLCFTPIRQGAIWHAEKEVSNGE